MKGSIGEFTPGASSTFHFESLPDHHKRSYAAIRKAIIADEDSVVLNRSYDMGTCMKLLESVLMDSPQLFWLDLACGVSMGSKTVTMRFVRNRFAKDKERLKAMIERNALEIYRKHIQGLRDAYSIELAVHDVLSTKISYDGTDRESSHSMVGPIIEKKGVCEGISKAAAFLLNCFGVESSVVSGKSREDGENHAWNVVRIDAQWYNTDVTFDLQKGAGEPIRFFLNMDDAMTSRTHIQETTGRCGSRKRNHYVMKGTYFKTVKDAVKYISEYRPDPVSRTDVYDLYVEEEGYNRIMAAISMKYIGKSYGTAVMMTSGRYLITVRRRRDGEERSFQGDVREVRQERAGEQPFEDARHNDGPQIRREGPEHDMVPYKGRA